MRSEATVKDKPFRPETKHEEAVVEVRTLI